MDSIEFFKDTLSEVLMQSKWKHAKSCDSFWAQESEKTIVEMKKHQVAGEIYVIHS